MRICTFDIKGVTPYSQSRMIDPIEFPKLNDGKESFDEYDERLWREKASFDQDGGVVIPAMGLKMAVDESIKRLNIGIKGRGKSTYAKFFVAGQICESDVPIGIAKDEMESIVVWANSDGVRGSGKRVRRKFPYHRKWAGEVRFAILDDIIPKDVFQKAVIEAGKLVGIGRFRPEKGGFLGRFTASNFKWQDA